MSKVFRSQKDCARSHRQTYKIVYICEECLTEFEYYVDDSPDSLPKKMYCEDCYVYCRTCKKYYDKQWEAGFDLCWWCNEDDSPPEIKQPDEK